MQIIIHTPPVSEPITQDEAKEHLRIEQTDDIENDYIDAIIKAAREHVEDICRRALLTQVWDYYLDGFPSADFIKLPFGNLQTTGLVITYYSVDTDDSKKTNTMTLTTDYLIETNGEACGKIVLPYGETWPSFTAWPTQAVKVHYTCGWTTRALVPNRIKAAIRLLCGDMYANRESQIVSGQPYHENRTVQRLLASMRLFDEF